MEEDFTIKYNVHEEIKSLCKASRSKLGLSNQDIADKISEKFNIYDFSVGTVNNFFSDRCKAPTIHTIGYICSVLNVSLDNVFMIEGELSSEEEMNYIKKINDLINENNLANKELEHINKHYDFINNENKELKHSYMDTRKKVPSWALLLCLIIIAILLLTIGIYLLVYDVNNPNYGLFV